MCWPAGLWRQLRVTAKGTNNDEVWFVWLKEDHTIHWFCLHVRALVGHAYLFADTCCCEDAWVQHGLCCSGSALLAVQFQHIMCTSRVGTMGGHGNMDADVPNSLMFVVWLDCHARAPLPWQGDIDATSATWAHASRDAVVLTCRVSIAWAVMHARCRCLSHWLCNGMCRTGTFLSKVTRDTAVVMFEAAMCNWCLGQQPDAAQLLVMLGA